MQIIQDANCLVTGGAAGIGLCYVRELLKSGAKHVCILDVDETSGRNATSELNSKYGNDATLFIKTDITNKKEFEDSFNKYISLFKKVDIFINNAGIMQDSKWELEIALNYGALVRGTFLGLDSMRKDKGGQGGIIINIASVVGLQPFHSLSVYSGTKHAVVGFSRAIGDSFHYEQTGVKIITICPGITETNLISEGSKTQLTDKENKACEVAFQKVPKQSPEHVAANVVKVIAAGTSGSVWVCHGGLPIYEVAIPDLMNLKKIENNLIT